MGVLVSRHAVVSVWAAHQGLCHPAEVDVDQPEAALLLRPQWQPLGLPLGDAASAALADAPNLEQVQALHLPGMAR